MLTGRQNHVDILRTYLVAVIPEHIVADTVVPAFFNIRGLVPISGAVILDAVDDHATGIVRDLTHINIVGAIVAVYFHGSARPGDIVSPIAVPIVQAHVTPFPVVLEVDCHILIELAVLTLLINKVVVQNIAFSLATDRAGLGLRAGTVYPLMTQGFAFGLTTDRASLGSGAGGILPLVIHLGHINTADGTNSILTGILGAPGMAGLRHLFTADLTGACLAGILCIANVRNTRNSSTAKLALAIIARILGIVRAALDRTVRLATARVLLGMGTIATRHIGQRSAVTLVLAGGYSAPSSAALVPCTWLNAIAIVSIRRDNKVSSLVPPIIPVIPSVAGIHPTEDHLRKSCRYLKLVKVCIDLYAADPDPFFAITEEIGRKACIVDLPVAVGLHVQIFWSTGRNSHSRQHTYKHAHCQAKTQQPQPRPVDVFTFCYHMYPSTYNSLHVTL